RHTRSYGDWSSDVCSSDLRRFPKSSGLVSVTCLPRDTLIRSSSQACSHRERLETNCLPASRCDISCLRVSNQAADGCLGGAVVRSEEHTSELQSPYDLVCR